MGILQGVLLDLQRSMTQHSIRGAGGFLVTLLSAQCDSLINSTDTRLHQNAVASDVYVKQP